MSRVPIHSVAAYPSLQARAAFPLDLVDRYGGPSPRRASMPRWS